jgi:mannose-6-phosphate isomerase-like protein (cupin superfamily)
MQTPLAFAIFMSMLTWAAPAAAGDEQMGGRLQELLRAHQIDIFGCVQAEPSVPKGEMLVRVVVGERGQVSKAEILKDDAKRAHLGRCLVGKVWQWDVSSLGAAPGDQVVFPLAFEPPTLGAVILSSQKSPFSLPGTQGTVQLLLDGTGASIALDRLVARAGASIPPHHHDHSEEVIYVLAGRGITKIGDKEIPIGAGDTVYIPAGVEHSVVVQKELTAIQVYSPAGPEQRFRQSLSHVQENR